MLTNLFPIFKCKILKLCKLYAIIKSVDKQLTMIEGGSFMNCNGCTYYEDDEKYANWGKCTYSKKDIQSMYPESGCKFYDIDD